MTYADLPFGQPVDPTLFIEALGFIEPLLPSQVGGPDDTIINGNMNVDFESTVTLMDLEVTDANGNPIPEPTSILLLMTVVGLCAVSFRKRSVQ